MTTILLTRWSTAYSFISDHDTANSTKTHIEYVSHFAMHIWNKKTNTGQVVQDYLECQELRKKY